MSPTSYANMYRESTATFDDVDLETVISHRVHQLRETIFPVESQRALNSILSTVNTGGVSSNLAPTRQAELWIAESRPVATSARKWFEALFDLQFTEASTDYLFAESIPERVPDEWIAELSTFRSADDDFVLPWNEPGSDDSGW